jgi:hypothetical protein
MKEVRAALPIYPYRQGLLDAIKNYQVKNTSQIANCLLFQMLLFCLFFVCNYVMMRCLSLLARLAAARRRR